MTKTLRNVTIALILALGLAQRAAAAGAGSLPRVRSSSPWIVALIEQAIERSHTFRSLVETISASDGIVYVEEGQCGHGVRACFVHVTVAGPNRLLWVRVDAHKADLDLMGDIGHELRHAVEVLGDPTVRSDASMYVFYALNPASRSYGSPHAFETDVAIAAGLAVRVEVRHQHARPEVH